PDVLFAGLQGQPVGHASVRVGGDADETPREVTRVGRAAGEEARVWAAEAHRHTEPLAAAEARVGALLPRRREDGRRQQVDPRGHQDPALVALLDERSDVRDAARAPRGLHGAPKNSPSGSPSSTRLAVTISIPSGSARAARIAAV